jgi:hypothetical protein
MMFLPSAISLKEVTFRIGVFGTVLAGVRCRL